MIQQSFVHTERARNLWSMIIQTGTAFFWAGLVLGLSFIETPLKFRAPGVTREIGLGIGQLVFGTLNRIELVLLVVLSGAVFLGYTSRIVRMFLFLIAFILLVQTFWLLPLLDLRTQSILAGTEPAPSLHHHLFIVVEASKVILLILFGIFAARQARI